VRTATRKMPSKARTPRSDTLNGLTANSYITTTRRGLALFHTLNGHPLSIRTYTQTHHDFRSLLDYAWLTVFEPLGIR
jgi:hypothetical protein